MIFSSYTYVVFLAVAFLLHWSLPLHARRAFLIAASYLFYASWRWEYCILLLAISIFNWAWGRLVLARSGARGALALGVAVNLAPLIYFKYTGFLATTAAGVANALGARVGSPVLDIVFPLGISFFVFHGISYLVDVASGERPLERLSTLVLFMAFWPQLVAGPIVRLEEMRDDLEGAPSLAYDDLALGCQRVLTGLFKKVVLADNLAPAVDMVFASQATPHFIDSVTGMVGFGLQIYFDFSGYSDIAIGSARLFGCHFPENFAWPYAAQSPQEFWNRWHMTLSRWIRDYLYTPLSFAMRRSPALAALPIVIAMAICGLWHGAAWTFVAWGVWHGLLLALNAGPLRGFFAGASRSRARAFVAASVTWTLVNLGWLAFRSASLGQAASLFTSIATLRGGLRPSILRENATVFTFAVFLALMIAQQLRGLRLERLQKGWLDWPLRLARPLIYAAMIVAVVIFDQEAGAFVYFQF